MYEYAADFVDGPAVVKLNGKYGFINEKNEVVLPFIYDEYSYSFERGKALVKLEGKKGYIDLAGNFSPIE
jgi:hypothetical protein